MNPNESESFDEKRIDLEAAEWVAKKVGGFTPATQDEFFEWLAADPRHSEWYAKHSRTWKDLNLLAEWMPEHSDKPNADLLNHGQRRQQWGWIAGAAAVAAVGLFVLFGNKGFVEEMPRSSTRNLVANAYESHAMEDGSVIELNRGAALKVDYHKDQRLVELISNEAHFEVAKDRSRPFVVSVGDIEVRAVGTAFNVRLDGDEVEVLVTEGSVIVTSGNAGIGDDTAEKGLVQELVAGEMSVLYLNDEYVIPEVAMVSAGEINELLAWKPQLLQFDSAPLKDVVSEFNRRNNVKIEIRDEDLETYQIVASFRTANVDHFVELLELTMGLRIHRENDSLITVHQAE